MIEVFTTNVDNKKDARLIISLINQMIPDSYANFDLDDCDRILRVEEKIKIFDVRGIIALLEKKGFQCSILTG